MAPGGIAYQRQGTREISYTYGVTVWWNMAKLYDMVRVRINKKNAPMSGLEKPGATVPPRPDKCRFLGGPEGGGLDALRKLSLFGNSGSSSEHFPILDGVNLGPLKLSAPGGPKIFCFSTICVYFVKFGPFRKIVGHIR